MKVIDVLIEIKNDTLPEGFKFHIGDDRYTYYVAEDGYLYYTNSKNLSGAVDWSIYKDWLNREIQIVSDSNE